MPRFLLTRRWIAGHLIVALIVGGCVIAGFWQLDRLDQRRESNARIEAQLARPPVALESLLETAPAGPGDLAYRRIEAAGTFDPGHETVLIGRTWNGQTGNDLLTPLVVGEGEALIVNRGWVPFEEDTPPVPSALPPSGTVEVTGVLLPPEDDTAESSDTGPSRTVATIDLGRLQASSPYDLVPAYLWLQSQSPAQAGSLPRPVPLPALDGGPHLNYAIQWFSFAAIGVVGYPLLIRREIGRRRSAEPGPT